jgi:hypothetical protein
MTNFTVDRRYNHIGIGDVVTWEQLDEIEAWCNAHGNYEVYATGIVYNSEQELVAFLLRWA